jgi:hypothetical protein
MIEHITVRAELDRVVVFRNGQFLCELPPEAAMALSRVLVKKAHQVEEHQKAQDIALDQATLWRAGVPLLLSGQKAIQQQALREAIVNDRLRRSIPSETKLAGIPTKERFGLTTITRHPPRKRP